MGKFNYEKAFTHGGTFHADDVFSAALLKTIKPDIEIERGFKVPEGYAGLAFDIGMGEFDHHQKDNQSRENGVPYAAFGKLWDKFAKELGISDFVKEKVEEGLVMGIDATDNGFREGRFAGDNLLSQSIAAMNPLWTENANTADDKFAEAVEMARGVLTREIEHAISIEKARGIVLNAPLENNGTTVMLPQYCPWQDFMDERPDAQYVVFPSNRGGYNVMTIPTEENPMAGRTPFPEEWLGRTNEELGITFCHPGNFILSTSTREEAVRVAGIAAAMRPETEKLKQGLRESVETPEHAVRLNVGKTAYGNFIAARSGEPEVVEYLQNNYVGKTDAADADLWAGFTTKPPDEICAGVKACAEAVCSLKNARKEFAKSPSAENRNKLEEIQKQYDEFFPAGNVPAEKGRSR